MPSHPATEAANQARQHLRSGLVALQEIALSATGRQRGDLLEIAERAAAIMGVLFSVERDDASEPERIRRLGGALAGLRRLLGELQQPACSDPRFEAVAQDAAAAVGALFLVQRTVAPEDPSPPPDPSQERDTTIPLTRRTKRAAERVRLDVDVGIATESNFYAGLSLDISTGGLFVATWTLYPVGTPITLTFELPGSGPILASGVVRWVREIKSGDASPGMGIAFTQIEPHELLSISEFCKRRQPMYYDDDG